MSRLGRSVGSVQTQSSASWVVFFSESVVKRRLERLFEKQRGCGLVAGSISCEPQHQQSLFLNGLISGRLK